MSDIKVGDEVLAIESSGYINSGNEYVVDLMFADCKGGKWISVGIESGHMSPKAFCPHCNTNCIGKRDTKMIHPIEWFTKPRTKQAFKNKTNINLKTIELDQIDIGNPEVEKKKLIEQN